MAYRQPQQQQALPHGRKAAVTRVHGSDETTVSLKLKKWRDELARKEQLAEKLRQEQRARERIFLSVMAQEDILADAWHQIFLHLGFGRDLAKCCHVSKFWKAIVSEGRNCAFSQCFFIIFGLYKPENLTWTQVFASFPSLLNIFFNDYTYAGKVDSKSLIHTSWLRQCLTVGSPTSGVIFPETIYNGLIPWALINGYFEFFLKIEEFLFFVEPQFVGKTKEECYAIPAYKQRLIHATRKPPNWSPKITLLLILRNGHTDILLYLLKRWPKFISTFKEVELFICALLACVEDSATVIKFTKHLTAKNALSELVYQTLMVGEVEVYHMLLAQGSVPTDLFAFNQSQCANIVDKCFKDLPELSKKMEQNKTKLSDAWQLEVERTLKEMRIYTITNSGRFIESVDSNFNKHRYQILKLVIDNGLMKNISMCQLFPCIGSFEVYKFFVDNTPDLPSEVPFCICSAVAQEEVSIDYQVLEYLLESKKVSPNVVNRFGNGLVYTAFVGANMRMLNLLQRYNADPNLFGNVASNSLFDLALHSSRYLGENKSDQCAIGELKERVLLPMLRCLMQFKGIKYPPHEDLLNYPSYLSSDMLLAIGVPVSKTDPMGMNLLQRAIFRGESLENVKRVIELPSCTPSVINHVDTTHPHQIGAKMPVLHLPALALLFYSRSSSDSKKTLGELLVRNGAEIDVAIASIMELSMENERHEEQCLEGLRALFGTPVDPEKLKEKTTATEMEHEEIQRKLAEEKASTKALEASFAALGLASEGPFYQPVWHDETQSSTSAPFAFKPLSAASTATHTTSPPHVPSFKQQRAKEKNERKQERLAASPNTNSLLPFASHSSPLRASPGEKGATSPAFGGFSFGSPVGVASTPTKLTGTAPSIATGNLFGGASDSKPGFTGFSASNFAFDFGSEQFDVRDDSLGEKPKPTTDSTASSAFQI